MLSIIVPTKNEEKYLGSLLKSIKNQSFKGEYEIIVADAGSKDKTVEIAKNYGCKIIAGGPPAKGRNEGAKIAQGDLLFFVDADSVLSPQLLNKLIDEFSKRKLDLASFPVYPQGNLIDKMLYSFYNFFAWATQKFLPHATQTILIKKEIHQKINGFDEKITIGEDHAYARAGAKIGKFGFLLTPSLLTSARRFEEKGRLKIYLSYLLAGIYMIFFGSIKSSLFQDYHSRGK